MASEASRRTNDSDVNDVPLRSIIETPLTDSLVNGIFQQQNNDGSFPATSTLGDFFQVDFEQIKRHLNTKGLDLSSILNVFMSFVLFPRKICLVSDEILRLISTASILFYFLYHSQKTNFPVGIDAIKQFVSNARAELESFSSKDDPIMQTYIDKGELAVKYVIDTREKYADVCKQINLSEPAWETYIQHLMGLGT